VDEHVARHHQHGDAAPLDGAAQRDLQDVRELRGDRGQLAVDAALAEQLLRVGLLEVVAADLGRGDVRGDGQHGNTAAPGSP
jgi:hypothetical protein